MSAALRYEWRRLVTIRSTYWLIGLTLVFQAVLTALVASGFTLAQGVVEAEETASAVLTLGASFGASPLFTAYIIAMFGVFTFGHEYRHGMIRATLTAVPNRSAVMTAKVLVVSALAAVLALACSVIGLLWSALLAGTGEALGSSQVWGIVLGTVVYTVLFGLCALAFAALTRNQTAGLAITFLLPLVVENILSVSLRLANDGQAPGVVKYLPYDAGAQMFARPSAEIIDDLLGGDPFGPVGGGVAMGVFALLLLAAAYASFLRRDA